MQRGAELQEVRSESVVADGHPVDGHPVEASPLPTSSNDKLFTTCLANSESDHHHHNDNEHQSQATFAQSTKDTEDHQDRSGTHPTTLSTQLVSHHHPDTASIHPRVGDFIEGRCILFFFKQTNNKKMSPEPR
ncbi:Hypothetical protein, putative [Bodo saltans]|uniref:Uncharacterized protein n=1 Tax=Bodo saltans TaxID=75058 RepID=A0A0S4IS04_BODSA|nr:Hypothetical protein, putative [Bodo saltans]|eukprot:CUF15892.1 Hypothetical protein, putative [Bodo saltans]